MKLSLRRTIPRPVRSSAEEDMVVRTTGFKSRWLTAPQSPHNSLLEWWEYFITKPLLSKRNASDETKNETIEMALTVVWVQPNRYLIVEKFKGAISWQWTTEAAVLVSLGIIPAQHRHHFPWRKGSTGLKLRLLVWDENRMEQSKCNLFNPYEV